MDEKLFSLLGALEAAGLWLSLLAWATVAAGAWMMARYLRRHATRAVRRAALAAGAFALAANLADFTVTLWKSPGLAIEANPLWRNVIEAWGLPAAIGYGLTGKIFLSLLAGQLFGFYLLRRGRLAPAMPGSWREFVLGGGAAAAGWRGRATDTFTVFAFFFAGIQPLSFYFAVWNAVEDPWWLDRMPSIAATVVALLLLLTGLLLADLYVARRTIAHPPARS